MGIENNVNLLGKRVVVTPHKELSTSYFGMHGVIEAYSCAYVRKRNRNPGDVVTTKEIHESWLVRFDEEDYKQIRKQDVNLCEALSLDKDMFKVV